MARRVMGTAPVPGWGEKGKRGVFEHSGPLTRGGTSVRLPVTFDVEVEKLNRRSNLRRKRRIERTKLEILRCAAEAFRRNGFAATTMEEIARRLHMTKGNLYYYFKSKEEILYFCQDYSLDLLLARLEEVRASAAPPDEQLHRLIRDQVSIILDELKASAMHADFHMLSPRRLRAIIRKRDQYERGIREIIREGMAQGIFRDGDPKLLAFAILGAINWTVRWFSPQGPRSAQEIGEVFAEYLVRGLRAEKADGEARTSS